MRNATVAVPGIATPLEFALHDADDKHISDGILTRGEWEPFETAVFTRLVRPVDLVVDAGANLGWYSVVGAACGASVVACEPMPANAALLRTNVERNGFASRVEIHECALGAEPGEALLTLSADNQGDHRVAPLNTETKRSTVAVTVNTLDRVLQGRRPALMKVDTQGSEVAILTGGRAAWAPQRGATSIVLLLEFWPYGLARCGASVGQLLDLLGELLDGVLPTHRCFEILEWRPGLREVTFQQLRAFATEGGYTEAARGFTNLAIVPNERVRAIFDLVATG
jgi:FkbM family methyltransferase